MMQIRTEYTDNGERIVHLVENGLMVTLRGEDAVEMLFLHDQEGILREQIEAIDSYRWKTADKLFRQRQHRATKEVAR